MHAAAALHFGVVALRGHVADRRRDEMNPRDDFSRPITRTAGETCARTVWESSARCPPLRPRRSGTRRPSRRPRAPAHPRGRATGRCERQAARTVRPNSSIDMPISNPTKCSDWASRCRWSSSRNSFLAERADQLGDGRPEHDARVVNGQMGLRGGQHLPVQETSLARRAWSAGSMRKLYEGSERRAIRTRQQKNVGSRFVSFGRSVFFGSGPPL